MKTATCLLILLPLIAGCVGSKNVEIPTPQQRADAGQVELLRETTNRRHKNLGKVFGAGCRRSNFDTNIPESDALLNLQLQAARLSADAVIIADCRLVIIDWFTDCFNLTECTGEAILFLDR